MINFKVHINRHPDRVDIDQGACRTHLHINTDKLSTNIELNAAELRQLAGQIQESLNILISSERIDSVLRNSPDLVKRYKCDVDLDGGSCVVYVDTKSVDKSYIHTQAILKAADKFNVERAYVSNVQFIENIES